MPDSPSSLAEPLGSAESLTGGCEAVRAEMLAAVGQVWRVQSGDLAEAAGAVAGAAAACLEPGNAPVAQRVLAGSMTPGLAVKVVREVG